MSRYEKSEIIYKEAVKYIPGGVNSPVRAFQNVGMHPIMIDSAMGSRLKDIDGNEYIDYIGSWGPMILGHRDPRIVETMQEAMAKGISYGLPTEIEVEMAKLITESYPVDMVRMVNSGTEATMSAIRLARGYTGRDKILKFEGNYHGHSDSLLVKSGSGTITHGVATSLGVTEKIIQDTLVARYNDLEDVKRIFEDCGRKIACIILEPIAANMGLVAGEEDFIRGLRDICNEYGTLLIFDEVISGFRIKFGGGAEIFKVKPDLACFGKIIGGGFPVGAYGGSKGIMELVSPLGGVYQAGTLSGNPLAMSTGIKNIEILRDNPNIYEHITKSAKKLEEGFVANIQATGVKAMVVRYEGLLTLFFGEGKDYRNYDDVQKADTAMYAKYFRQMLDRGIMCPPSQFEAIFISSAHTDEDIEKTIRANKEALQVISQ
ncbi:MAG TPA: glutamate-1-semialdehyde 2,1-aminomutase [Clostridiaceae bacterium]|nr:glutamate-1-semialdehyde 2,1-aminomutase [Clostridiaceae bacterium]